jgi:hypothetical protein
LLLLGRGALWEKGLSSLGVCAAWGAWLAAAVLMLLWMFLPQLPTPPDCCWFVVVQHPKRLPVAAAVPPLAWTAAAAAGLPAVLLHQLLCQALWVLLPLQLHVLLLFS